MRTMVSLRSPLFLLYCVLFAALATRHATEAFSGYTHVMDAPRGFGVGVPGVGLSARVVVSPPKRGPSLAKASAQWASKGSDDEGVDVSSSLSVASWVRQNKRSVAMAAAALTAAVVTGPVAPALADIASAEAVASSATSLQGLSQQLSDTGFYQAFSLVFLSEIGDKTFFVAGLLAAKLSKFVSFVGSLGALAVMTIIAVLIGQIFHAVPPGLTQGLPIDDICAVAAFAFFGIKILSEALESGEGESVMEEELADAEEAVDGSDTITKTNALAQIASTFALVFAAEFGDRSFLSTIALSAAQNPFAVAGGSIAAHGIATGIAVVGGAYISKYLSERVIGIIGGTLFLVFAVTTALGIF